MLAGVPGAAAAVPAPDTERLASLQVACGKASAVRVITARAIFTSDRPSLDETGVRLSTPGGRPALITGPGAAQPGRLIEWSEIERVDAGRRLVLRRTLLGLGVGMLGAGLMLASKGRDISADGDNVMLVIAGFTLGASTAAGYLYGTGYPIWRRVYP